MMSSLPLTIILLLLVGGTIYTVYPTVVVVHLTIEAKGKMMVTLIPDGKPEEYSILVFDENGIPLPYSYNGTHITIYPLNSSIVNIVYEAKNLLKYLQERGIWELRIKPKSPCKVILPYNTVILHYTPEGRIAMEEGRLVVFFNKPGEYDIKFTLVMEAETPTITPTTTPPKPTTPTTTPPAPLTPTVKPILQIPIHMVAILAIVIAIIAAIILVIIKRK